MSEEKQKEAEMDRQLTPTPTDDKKKVELISGDQDAVSEGAVVHVNGTKTSDKEEKKEKAKPVNLIKLFRYATWFDRILILLGTIAAIAHGAALPMLMLIFGDILNVFLHQFATLTTIEIYQTLLPNLTFTCSLVFSIPEENLTNITLQTLISENFTDSTCSLGDEFIDAINYQVYLFIGIGLAVFLIASMQISFFQIAAERQVYRIRLYFYRAVLRQDIAWFDGHPTGAIANRLSDDIDKISAGIGDKLSILIQWVTTFFAGFAVAFAREWRLTLLLLAFTPFMAISGAVLGKLTAAFTSREQKQYAGAGAVAEEVLSSIRTVFAFGGEKYSYTRYDKRLKEARRLGAKKGISVGVSLAAIFFLLFTIYAVGFWFGAYIIANHGVLGGTVLTVFFSVVIGAFSLGQAAPNLQNLFTAAGAAGTIYETIDRIPPIDSSSNEGAVLEKFTPTVELKNVNFTYPTRQDVQVMHNVDLKVEVGQTVALVGPSGCGKSTIVQLIQRFYDVNEGEVLVGGVNVKELNLKWLRSHIGVVSQEPVLFDTTIAENIRYGREEASLDEIQEAAKNANAHDFISSLPKGYDTLVGEGGTQMSGGQKQRIAIARALVSNPKILLLDEATSALDTESEAVVQEALDRAREGRTTIVIAHRLSTIQNADIIVSIDEGKVVEFGSHSELMTNKKLYYDLVTAQSFDVDDVFINQDISEFFSQRKRKRSERISESSGGLQRHVSYQKQESNMPESPKKQLSKQPSAKEEEEEDKEIPEVSVLRILSMNAREWWLLLLGCLGAAVNGAIFPLFAVLFGEVLKVFARPPDQVLGGIHLWSGMFIVLGAVSGLAIFMKVICFEISGEYLTFRLRSQLFKAMLRQEVGWFDEEKHSTGALVTRLASDAGQVQGATGNRLGTLMETVVGMLLALFIAFYYSWIITFVILGVVPLLIVAGALEWKALTSHNASTKKKLETAGKISVDSIENIRTVASLTVEENFYQQYKVEVHKPYLDSVVKHPPVYGMAYGFSQALIYLMYAVVFRFGAFLTDLPPDHLLHVSFEEVFRVFMAIVFGAITVGQASAFAPNYAKAKLSANRIFFILDRVPLIDNYSEDGEKLDKVTGKVEAKDVKFSYPTRPDVKVLQGLNLTLNPGKTLALVGPSGCGKSTVVSLIERFYDPSEGLLTMEGVDIKDINLQWLRSQVGIVSQEPVLFDDSIAENIRYGALFREVPDEEIIEAAKAANIHSFIESLPQGYNTNVGSKGTQLSGGQKQRVAIARALVRDPKILLLDEATSALDTESEKIVQEALDKAREGRTSIVIAHRLSTIYNADAIAVIQGGKVAELGTHSELLEKKGIYYHLNRFQMIATDETEGGSD